MATQKPLPSKFYQRDAVALAQALLGQILYHHSTEGITSGLIVETESYLGKRDPASHAFRGPTPRNLIMFGPAGYAYIYFTYGMHYCFNIVAGETGTAEAVLIRALEPMRGIELMEQRRRLTKPYDLCSGPAKLVQALGITKDLNGHDITQPPLQIMPGPPLTEAIVTGPRIGISQATDLPLRFFLKGNPYTSRKQPPV